MSASRTTARLLRLYPSAWRERYGEELEALVLETRCGDRLPWRVRFDVVRAATRERLRAAGLQGDGEPVERVRGGSLLVLSAWTLLVIAGAGIQRFSEHWRDLTPTADHALASGAFTALVVAAIGGGVLMLGGIGVALPSMNAFVRAGGWASIRRHVVAASWSSVVAIAATTALVTWSKHLTPSQRDGGDVGYAFGFVGWALVCVSCLTAWTVAAVATGRRLQLRRGQLRAFAWLSVGVTASIVVVMAATVTWWVAMADTAPWFLAGRPAGEGGSPVAAPLVVFTALMALATLLAVSGATRAVGALPALGGGARRSPSGRSTFTS